MPILDALIPSASADVVAIFPEGPPVRVDIPGEISLPELPDIPGLPGLPEVPDAINVPLFIPLQLFAGARPMRAIISEPSQFMVHPLESGARVTDHRIIQPVEISITFVLEPERYRLTYQLIRQAFINGVRLSVQTRATTYTGMYISDMPHEEDPAFFDTISMVIQFRQVQVFDTRRQAISDVIDPSDTETADVGQQNPTSPTDEQDSGASILHELFGRFF